MSLRIFEVLDIGKQSVFSHQAAMGVTGHNIANVNTPGFSRQRPVFETLDPQIVGGVSFGRGSEIATVIKSYDQFLNAQLSNEASILGQWQAKESHMTQLETIFNESSEVGLNNILSEFWNAWQDPLPPDSGSSSERRILLAKAQAVADTLQKKVEDLGRIRLDANNQIASSVNQINQIATEIADLNEKVLSTLSSRGNPNDFTDTRTRLMEDLAALIDFDAIEEKDGQVTILVGKGRMLVSENQAWRLSVFADPERDSMLAVNYVDNSGTLTDITDDIRGGNLKGMLETRDVVVPAYLDKLDLLAATLVNEVNAIHYVGHGLDGSSGNYFFSPNKLVVGADDENKGGARIYNQKITDPTQLKSSDFEIRFRSETTYNLYDTRDQEYLFHLDNTNNAIRFNDDGGVSDAKAILAQGTYTGTELAAEIEKQLESKSAATGQNQSYTVTYDKRNRKFTIKNDTGNANALIIRWSSADTNAEQILGFNNHDDAVIATGAATVSDVSGGTYLYADYTFTIAAGANTIMFDDDGGAGGPFAATLTAGTYNSYDLAAEIERQLEAASGAGQSYTVTFDRTNRTFVIANDSGNANNLDLLWGNAGTTAETSLGFAAVDTLGITPGSSDTGDNTVGTYINYNTIQLYGMSVQVANDTGTPQAGDLFTLSGVKDAARNIAVNGALAVDANQIAAASSIFHINTTNNVVVFDDDGAAGAPTYTATLTIGDYTAEDLAAEIERQLEAASGAGQSYTVTYDKVAHRFSIRNEFENSNSLELLWDNVGTTAAQILGFDNAAPDTVATDSATTSDVQTYEYGEGDNSNALAIADLQHAKTMSKDTMSIDGFYNSLVSGVGIEVQGANRNLSHQQFMIEQLNQRRDSIAGVSLEEEMTNLIKFQQAFSASAKLIATVDEMLDVLVNI